MPPPPPEQTAKLIMVAPLVTAMYGWPPVAPFANWEGSKTVGITEPLFNYEKDNTLNPWLADSWVVSKDFTKYQMTLKKGIKFNSPVGTSQDFGEFTADDVAFYINQCNSTTNSKTTCGDAGNLAALFGEVKVIDKYTVEIAAVGTANPLAPARVVSTKISMRSKKAFDTMGLEWMKEHAVGTGPFVQKDWVPNVRGVVEAVPTHWASTARIKQFTLVEVPELATQQAMLRTGQAHIASMAFQAVYGMIQEGFKFLPGAGGYVTENISAIFAGNLWEEKSARNGTPLEPWKSPAYAKDYPWIGNPWGNKVPYTDTDNPSGVDDMEQARLVRWALSMAIDRDAIVRDILHGMGGPIYIEYISPTAPGWDNKWKVPYDTTKAKEYLAKAGYPNGFDITINVYPAEVGPVALEIGDAVTSMWQKIGIKVTQERVDYGAIVSPKLRLREAYQPVLKNCDVFGNWYPLDWPFPPTETSLSRPGWGCGFETPTLADLHLKISAEQDTAKRIAMHKQAIDHVWEQMFEAGIIERPNGVVVNPKFVAAWDSHKSPGSGWNYPQFIVPAQ